MANSQQPPKPDGSGMIVMTRLNTIGLRKLANGGLVESRPPAPLPAAGSPARQSTRPKSLDDALKLPELRASDVTLTPPPQPARTSTPPPARASAPPPAPLTAQAAAKAIAEIDVQLDALFDDSTSRIDPADLGIPALETTVTESPSAKGKAAAKAEAAPPKPDSRPPAIGTGDPRLDVETPTALFVKDIQRSLQEEIKKQQTRDAATQPPPAAGRPAMSASVPPPLPSKPPVSASAAPPAFPKPAAVPLALAETQKQESKPESKPGKSTGSNGAAARTDASKPQEKQLPAPLPAQAHRRRDPAAVSMSMRPQRIERKGGFVPWAAALTALGVFIGVAGARAMTGMPFTAVAAPAAAPAPQSAPVAAPAAAPPVAETTKVETVTPVKEEAKPEPKPEKVEAKTEPVKAETKTESVKAEPVKAEPAKVEHAKAEPKPEKAEAKVEKPEPRPAPRRAAPPPVERNEEPVAAKPAKPEPKAEAPAPRPAKADSPAAKSGKPDVAAAARDYAAVDSQLGQSL